MATEDKPRVDPASYMTDRMVSDRCTRMWRNGQWLRLHEFCTREPRGRTWTLSRIAQLHAVSSSDPRVYELFDRLSMGRTPRERLDHVVPGGPISDSDVVEEVVENISDEDVEIVAEAHPAPAASARPRKGSEAPVAASTPPRKGSDPPTPVASPSPRKGSEPPAPVAAASKPGSEPPALAAASPPAPVAVPQAFLVARDEGDFVAAGEIMLTLVRGLPPGTPPPFMAVEVREILSEIARAGGMKLIVDLCSALPSRLVASALIDMGDKLRIGALVHESVLRFQHALQGKEGRSAVKAAEQDLVENVRKVLPDQPE